MGNSILQFWEDRGKTYGSIAGSNDFILKEIEQSAILSLIQHESEILEFGCGNGDTLLKIVKETNSIGRGYDFSAEN